jgi:two-component system response regulator HydG
MPAVDAVKRGAFQYMVKPFQGEGLRRAVTEALDEGRRRRPNVGSPRLAHGPPTVSSLELIGPGPAMHALQTAIDFVARSDAPVLVTGETGVGKELVAHAIHARSARCHSPFVAVNTAAIPQALLEGEIFGYARGAFTGAVHARKGLLTEADGGTLLLDEIGDMPIALQAKLLRVLQFGDIRPLGSDRSHHVDVRIVTASHRDLGALIKEGQFREDLYYRLNVLPVRVPPLRDRREDIPALASHFLAEACMRAPRSPVRSIGDDAVRALCEASWPGNVRELAGAIERAVVFGQGETIGREHLSLRSGSAPALEGGAQAPTWPFPSDAPWTLRRLSRAYTAWTLSQTGGNKERAAEILGIDLSTLYRWQRVRQG